MDVTIIMPHEMADALLFYLSRSVFRDKGEVANIVAEEADAGNELAIKAMAARDDMMNLLTKRGKHV